MKAEEFDKQLMKEPNKSDDKYYAYDNNTGRMKLLVAKWEYDLIEYYEWKIKALENKLQMAEKLIDAYPDQKQKNHVLSVKLKHQKRLGELDLKAIDGFKQEIAELKEDLVGNHDGSLDEFLLNSVKYTQEERELVMEVISEYLLNKH